MVVSTSVNDNKIRRTQAYSIRMRFKNRKCIFNQNLNCIHLLATIIRQNVYSFRNISSYAVRHHIKYVSTLLAPRKNYFACFRVSYGSLGHLLDGGAAEVDCTSGDGPPITLPDQHRERSLERT